MAKSSKKPVKASATVNPSTVTAKKSKTSNEKTPRNFRIGGAIQPTRDLGRFVRWPKYVRLQRQKRVLLQRLKIPPAINQFRNTLTKDQSSLLLRLLAKYKPESALEKKQRLVQEAFDRKNENFLNNRKSPIMLKYGLNHVTDLVEIKKAKLVVIAHDVDPIELIVWLPALCRKKDVPYCIIKGKSRLGQLVHKKNTCVVAIDKVRREDTADFDTLCKTFRAQFNDNLDARRKWGEGVLGFKSQNVQRKKEQALQIEQAKKMGLMTM